jgi:branched-chain amino acid transport system ATP-binding protein
MHVTYGKIRAVQGIDLDVAAGEIVALIGANGAGKSSTLRAICGIEKVAEGAVSFKEEDITDQPSHIVLAKGIAHVPEGRMIFGNLTIEENLRLGGIRRKESELGRAIAEVVEMFPQLRGRLAERGSALSGGQAQMLALARGVIANPELLLLDEPALGLAPRTAGEIFDIIRGLRDRGLTIALVEQNLRQALAVADRGYVIESGRIVLEGASGDLLENDYLHEAYLGVKREDRA